MIQWSLWTLLLRVILETECLCLDMNKTLKMVCFD